MSDRPSEADVRYRSAVMHDADAIVRFNLQLAEETEGRRLDADTIRRGVLGGLQRSPEARYFVAESSGDVVGQLMITREWSDWRNGWMLWLQSVYVEQEFRGRGVFRELLQHALQMVHAQEPAVGLRLYVERENAAAMAVYDRLGFEDASYNVLEIVPLLK